MKKIKLLIFLLFSIIGTLFAQSSPPDPAAFLNNTAQRYNVLPAFSFKFTVSVDDPVVKNAKITGQLFIKKEKYYLKLDDQIIANDGVTMWNYQKTINEVSFFDATDDDFSLYHPIRILNSWDKDYNAKTINEEMVNNVKVTIIDLTPKKQLTFYKMRLYIENSTSLIQKIMIYQIDSPTITYSITKFTFNDTIEDSIFTFNKKDYPNVHVNDMR